MSLVEKLKSLCEGKSTNFAAVERALDFGQGTIRKWDKSSPSTDKIEAIADYFGVSVDYLLGRENGSDESEFDSTFFRLKKGLEPYGLDKEDAEFLLTVYRAHKEKNK